MKINKKIIVLLFLTLLLVMAFYPLPQIEPNRYVERKSGEVKTEKVAGENWLQWLYYNPVGEATMFTLIKRKFFSSWYGDRMDSPSSEKKIMPFIEDYQIRTRKNPQAIGTKANDINASNQRIIFGDEDTFFKYQNLF